MRKHNFNAGPSILPKIVLNNASESLLELNDIGMSVLEISHRGVDFGEIISEAKSLINKLLGLSDDQEILFLQGGASMQFMMIPYNFLGENEKAAYVNTGIWSSKAIKEAKLFGNVDVVGSSEKDNFKNIPQGIVVPNGCQYLHITSNNTIYGTQYNEYPKTDRPLVVDMSSDIFSRELDMSSIDFIYAGAQKNLGSAGVTLIIVKREMLDRIQKTIPSMMDYRVYVKNNSLYNTPPVFAIYTCLLTLRWLDKLGGVSEIEKQNDSKAKKLYDAIDKLHLYKGFANEADRSKMNVTFKLTQPALEAAFLSIADNANIEGIKGHRSVGGFRASLYNALPEESVDVLVEVMTEFAEKHG